MYSKTSSVVAKTCTACGKHGHTNDDCWSVVGYLKWHNKNKKTVSLKYGFPPGKWQQNRGGGRIANIAQSGETQDSNDGDNVMITTKQLEQLLKMLLADNQSVEDTPFSGMVLISKWCNHVIQSSADTKEWIVDSGATDHMTSDLSLLSIITVATSEYNIRLPTGDVAIISHIGDLILQNGLKLLGVLFVPAFNHNLVSIHKLAQDNDCSVVFVPEKCLILDSNTQAVKGIGVLKHGIYYLSNESIDGNCNYGTAVHGKDSFSMWHNRLRHAPEAKIKFIQQLKYVIQYDPDHIYLTCPMARFTKLPYGDHIESVLGASIISFSIWLMITV